MSDNRNIPKNVELFINKYGNLGSMQQDSAFWKEFSKAANAYADTQAHRICDLERQLSEVTKQRDMLVEALRRIDLHYHAKTGGLTCSCDRCDQCDSLADDPQIIAREALSAVKGGQHE